MSIPHDYVLAQICGELDDALHTAEEWRDKYRHKDKSPFQRRIDMEQYLKHKDRAEQLMRELVNKRTENLK